MAIEKTNVIDAIGIDNSTGDLVLTIVDHLPWGENGEDHLINLQEKINTYLSFVESGELLEVYPIGKNKSVLIDVVIKYPLSLQAQEFFREVEKIIENAGMKIQHRIFDDSL